ncbi:MAG: DUF1343 domain-containing protein, partial [Bdellovibrionales bacterium]|nr:DUF1343 domain-containing protein [Bdellovibrionales bacterium]
LAFTMVAAKRYGKRVVVIDRPNPIGGERIEGPSLEESCRSFCGLYPCPVRHGLTIGELAQMFNAGFSDGDYSLGPIECDLHIEQMSDWQRSMQFEDTLLPWVPPSPNMPTVEAARIYPGGCLFEATNISEGRGTTKPFEFFGAPYIDGYDWAAATCDEDLPLEGAILRPVHFIPKFSKWADKHCGGVQLHITDQTTFQPVRWCLALIAAAKRLYPDLFNWRQGSYEFVRDVPAIDLLFGSNRFRKAVDTRASLEPIGKELAAAESRFAEARTPFLLYA